MRARSPSSGFSLIEMLFTLAVSAILFAIALPSAVQLHRGYQRSSARTLFAADVRRAAARAARLGTRVVLSFSILGERHSFGPDYAPYASPAAPETVEFSRAFSGNYALSPTQALIFDGRGVLVDAAGRPTSASLTLNENGAAVSVVTILPTGIVRFQ